MSVRAKLIGGARSLAICAPVATLVLTLLAAPAHGALVFTKNWNSPQPSLWIAGNDGSHPRRLVPGEVGAISPDGRIVVYEKRPFDDTLSSPKLMAVPASGGKPRVLLRITEGLAAWSPDSRTIAALVPIFSRPFAHTRLVAIDVASGRVSTLATANGFTGASFSPDGHDLVYGSVSVQPDTQSDADDLFRVGVRSRRRVRLTSDHDSAYPLWGPRGIALTRQSGPAVPSTGLDLMRTPTSALDELIPPRTNSILTPTAWSTDGHRLLAEDTHFAPESDQALAVDPANGHARPISTRPGKPIVGFDLSRNGSAILATVSSPNGHDIVTVPYRGGPQRTLAEHAVDPSWSR